MEPELSHQFRCFNLVPALTAVLRFIDGCRIPHNVILDGQKGLIVGDAATIYETQDGGKSWNEIKAPELMRQLWFHAVVPLAGNKYLVAGAHGSVVFIEDSKISK